jgi:hypothetical protein
MDEQRPLPPSRRLWGMISGARITQMIYVAAALGIADELAGGPRSVEDLAAATHTDADALGRILRALASLGVFRDLPDGRIELTEMAELLRSDAPDSLRPLAFMVAAPLWWQLWGRLEDVVRRGQSGFQIAHGRDMFDYLAEDPVAEAEFSTFMSALTRDVVDAVVDAYDMNGVRLLVDVGGGRGGLASAFLRRYRQGRAIVFDRGPYRGTACRLEGDAEVDSRWQFASGDFFEAVPAGGDLYVLKDILHDWDDARAVRILQRCRQAVPPDGRMIVVERLLDGADRGNAARQVDVAMLVLTGGRERTEQGYRHILARGGWRLRRVVPTAVDHFVLEATPTTAPATT